MLIPVLAETIGFPVFPTVAMSVGAVEAFYKRGHHRLLLKWPYIGLFRAFPITDNGSALLIPEGVGRRRACAVARSATPLCLPRLGRKSYQQGRSQSHYTSQMGKPEIWKKRTCYGLENVRRRPKSFPNKETFSPRLG